MATSAGAYDRRVQILRQVTNKGPAGDVRTTYEPRFSRWARVMEFRGRIAEVAQQQGVELWDMKVALRFDDKILLTDRFVYKGQQYTIIHRAEVGRRVEYEFQLKRVP